MACLDDGTVKCCVTEVMCAHLLESFSVVFQVMRYVKCTRMKDISEGRPNNCCCHYLICKHNCGLNPFISDKLILLS